MKTLLILVVMAALTVACSSEPKITADMVDGGKLFDPSIYHPELYLVSKAIPNPTPAQAQTPVMIACHGYTSTTFEWDELRTFLGGRTDVFLSQVLLGGHGRSYADFKKSTWQDWQSTIIDEYSQLEKAGYKNISLVGSSTSGALLLQLVASGYFANRPALRNILLVDPIIIPSNKTLSLVEVFGPMLGYSEATDQSAAEDKVSYRFRPQETLQQLEQLLNVVRKDLEQGITLPANVAMKVYKSRKDTSADPVSAVLIYNGTKNKQGQPIDIQLIDSEFHVYTRLSLRPTVTTKDQQNQKDTFTDIVSRVRR